MPIVHLHHPHSDLHSLAESGALRFRTQGYYSLIMPKMPRESGDTGDSNWVAESAKIRRPGFDNAQYLRGRFIIRGLDQRTTPGTFGALIRRVPRANFQPDFFSRSPLRQSRQIEVARGDHASDNDAPDAFPLGKEEPHASATPSSPGHEPSDEELERIKERWRISAINYDAGLERRR